MTGITSWRGRHVGKWWRRRSGRRARRPAVRIERLEVRNQPAVVIDVGDYVLQPDTADQIIDLQATGLDEVTGLNLRAQLGEAGEGPVFQSVQFSDGPGGEPFIWDAHPTTVIGQAPVDSLPHLAQISVLFSASGQEVAADGLIARLHVDTTGITEGTFPLRLSETVIGRATDFILTGADTLQPAIVNGSIRIDSHPWHNADNPTDVDADGNVFPIDALLVINALNDGGTGPLPVPVTPDNHPPPYVDVMPDNQLYPIDALIVINKLIDLAESEGADPSLPALESEGGVVAPSAATRWDMASDFFFTSRDHQRRVGIGARRQLPEQLECLPEDCQPGFPG